MNVEFTILLVKSMKSDAVTDMTPEIWSHVRLARSKKSRRRRNLKRTLCIEDELSKLTIHIELTLPFIVTLCVEDSVALPCFGTMTMRTRFHLDYTSFYRLGVYYVETMQRVQFELLVTDFSDDYDFRFQESNLKQRRQISDALLSERKVTTCKNMQRRRLIVNMWSVSCKFRIFVSSNCKLVPNQDNMNSAPGGTGSHRPSGLCTSPPSRKHPR
ncbi:hypothetical protein J6590_056718 [Homalodisca vitripennis]|nr:hypothetical protein J6590_056718 [Homalodisca vitripennis]